MMPDPYPWERDRAFRPVWHSAASGFASPWWCGADSVDRCVACESLERERARAPRRAIIAADSINTARMSGISVGTPELIRETARACRYEWPDGMTAWIPKSCILAIEDGRNIYIRTWFYVKELAPLVIKAAA